MNQATNKQIKPVVEHNDTKSLKLNKKNKKIKQEIVNNEISTKQEPIIIVDQPIEQVIESSEEHEKMESYDDVYKALLDIDKDILNLHRKRSNLIRIGYKLYTKEKRQFTKKSKKNANISEERKTSGFNKPKLVPDVFCNYLGLEIGTILPRTKITSQLYAKLKQENLLDAADQRKIITNDTVRALFMMRAEEKIEFESFQHYVARVYTAFNELNKDNNNDNDTINDTIDANQDNDVDDEENEE